MVEDGRCHVMAAPDLLAFAEDPQVFVAIGPDQERIMTERFVLTFSPGEHFWSTSVARVRFDVGDVRGGVREVGELVRRRGRRSAAWTIGPSATPRDVVPRLLEIGLEPESDEGSVMLVMTTRQKLGPRRSRPAGSRPCRSMWRPSRWPTRARLPGGGCR